MAYPINQPGKDSSLEYTKGHAGPQLSGVP
jgi:hypothetical protein